MKDDEVSRVFFFHSKLSCEIKPKFWSENMKGRGKFEDDINVDVR
jgi:hypothetical protein